MRSPPYPLTVVAKERLAPRHVLVTLDSSGSPFERHHTAPGQYALMGWHREQLTPCALASVPGRSPHEVVIGANTDEEEAALLSERGPLWSSDPQGRGFPLERARSRPLLLFAGGSAIGAIRAVVETLLLERDAFGPVSLYYGVRSSRAFCFRGRYAAWRAAGVDVTLVASRESLHLEGEELRLGYVQEHLPDAIDGAARAIAFVCGRPEMESAVTRALVARGVSEEHVFRNWR